MAPHHSILISVYCLGPFAVQDSNGRRLPVQNQKSKALIALLATAPRGERTRAWLRDKLWSDRSEEQASGSLRQTLLEIRKALGPELAHLLAADKRTVTLNLNHVDVDISRYRADLPALQRVITTADLNVLEVLEGIDIADPEFEEWLTVERSNWADVVESARRLPRRHDQDLPAVATGTGNDDPSGLEPRPTAEDLEVARPDREFVGAAEPIRTGVGLLPNICDGMDSSMPSVADLIAEVIAGSLCELEPVDIYDLRDTCYEHFGLPRGEGPELMTRIRIMRVGAVQCLSLLVYRASSMKLVWSNTIQGNQDDVLQLDSETVSCFIAQSVDRLAHAIFGGQLGTRTPSKGTARASYMALNLIFRDSVEDMEAAERLLEKKNEEDPKAVYMGLLAYISSFRVGEHLGHFDKGHREATALLAHASLNADPYNSLALSCVGHVRGYVMRDFESAGELLTRAIQLNPHQAFAWDHYALFNLYIGRLGEALRASQKAVLLGSYSPLRYSFETTRSMVATLLGDHATAIHYGRRSLSRQPRFKATKRYLIAAYGLAGEREQSEALINDLATAEPSFSMESLRADTIAVLDHGGRYRLLEGYRLAGLT